MPLIKLILNLPDRSSPLSLILGELASKLEGVRIIPIGNIEGIKSVLRRNPDSRNLVVLSVESEADLNALFDMEAFLQGTDLILIMPEDKPGLRSRARRLRPRYIATLPDELNDLPLILEATVKKMELRDKQITLPINGIGQELRLTREGEDDKSNRRESSSS